MKPIKIPRVSFALGDPVALTHTDTHAAVRPLYGPANPAGARPLVGWIRRDAQATATLLMDMLEYADAHRKGAKL